MTPILTPTLIHGAGRDAGTAHARAHGRKVWNAEDRDVAVCAAARLWEVYDRDRPGQAPPTERNER